MKRNEKLGGIVALISGLIGITGHFILFLNWYVKGMSAESAEPGCEILLKYIHPAMTDLGIVGGVIFLVSAYGFFNKKNWAFLLSVIAIVLSLQGAWFVNVPFMAAGMPPLLALPGHLFHPYDFGRKIELEPYNGRSSVWHGLGLLLDERNRQHEPHHHHRRSDLCPGTAHALDRHVGLGHRHRLNIDGCERMDLGYRIYSRSSGSGSRLSACYRHRPGIGALFPVLAGPNQLPGPGGDHGLAGRSVAALDRVGVANDLR
jgi:hypothetical protein